MGVTCLPSGTELDTEDAIINEMDFALKDLTVSQKDTHQGTMYNDRSVQLGLNKKGKQLVLSVVKTM